MSRLERVKNALGAAVAEHKRLIEDSHKKGKVPADYSLGFCNAMIFCDHHINLRDGDPKFYDRTTSIGNLPKPMVLREDKFKDVLGAEKIFEELRDGVILAARNVCAAAGPDATDLQVHLVEAVDKMDKFVDDMTQAMKESEGARQGEVDGSSDGASVDQESSSLSRAPSKHEFNGA